MTAFTLLLAAAASAANLHHLPGDVSFAAQAHDAKWAEDTLQLRYDRRQKGMMKCGHVGLRNLHVGGITPEWTQRYTQALALAEERNATIQREQVASPQVVHWQPTSAMILVLPKGVDPSTLDLWNRYNEDLGTLWEATGHDSDPRYTLNKRERQRAKAIPALPITHTLDVANVTEVEAPATTPLDQVQFLVVGRQDATELRQGNAGMGWLIQEDGVSATPLRPWKRRPVAKE